MGSVSSIKVPSVIEPGETITFKLNLVAPNDPGTYTGRWEIFTDEDEAVGWYSVVIDVVSAIPADFAVTGASVSNVVFPADLTCPYNAQVSFAITANAAGDVTYKVWDSFSGSYSSTRTVTFNSAGTKTVNETIVVFADGEFFVSIDIVSPNNQEFGPYSIFAICNP